MFLSKWNEKNKTNKNCCKIQTTIKYELNATVLESYNNNNKHCQR